MSFSNNILRVRYVWQRHFIVRNQSGIKRRLPSNWEAADCVLSRYFYLVVLKMNRLSCLQHPSMNVERNTNFRDHSKGISNNRHNDLIQSKLLVRHQFELLSTVVLSNAYMTKLVHHFRTDVENVE